MEPEGTAGDMKLLDKYNPAAAHPTIKQLLGVVFSMLSVTYQILNV
jgi:hypothetical protein